MRCVLVSHTHWDREWYRTFEAFRSRLVDTVDRVLELVAADPGFHFQLDGQAIVVEDYLAVRPERRDELIRAVRSGRVALGPWYVQPDSLIPAGETHVRNLLEGRRIALEHGGCSTIAYTPDSFGHPDQFPQLFAGFGLGPFVYWRGNGNEIAELPADYRWRGADGSEVIACHLARGYFAAWGLADDTEAAVARLRTLGEELAESSDRDRVLLMNGIDHMLPDANTREVAEGLVKATGWEVVRGLLDDHVEDLVPAFGRDLAPRLPVYAGELIGGRVANLLPGVWSTHVDLKLANRRCETALLRRAEPFAALSRWIGRNDERPSLRLAWRTLLPNQAHDSICGCSQDRVHEQMTARFDTTLELADETTARLLDRLAGLPTDRQPEPATDRTSVEVAVWNPHPRPVTGLVEFPLTGFPAFSKHGIAPLLALNLGMEGLTANGRPARVIVDRGNRFPMLRPDRPAHVVQALVDDVPAFGWTRLRLARSPSHPDRVDEGREIAAGDVRVTVDDEGLLDVQFGDRVFRGLAALEDHGDRGDTYDFDPVGDGAIRLRSLRIERRRHPSGIEELEIERCLDVPRALDADRRARSAECVPLGVIVRARVAPGLERVDLSLVVDNTACDHRLRMRFPTGRPVEHFEAASTFGSKRRTTERPDDREWIHPAPGTFPLQGHLEVGGLGVGAPGLIEAEVDRTGTLSLTLLRSVGWLSRPDLTTRPGEAGPSLPTPGAQCLGEITARISLYPAAQPWRADEAECGLVASGVGPGPRIAPDAPLLQVTPAAVEVSTLKPAERDGSVVLRLQNPTDAALVAHVELGRVLADAVAGVSAVRLDESPDDFAFSHEASRLSVPLPAHALRSLRIDIQPRPGEPA